MSPDRSLAGVEIFFPDHLYWSLVAHARRKLRAEYLPGEERERKAYGLVGARLYDAAAEVTAVFPLSRNLRDDPLLKPYLDRIMEEVAVRSETPLERRGWVTDPREVMEAERRFEDQGAVLLGGYHMHRVPWAHDPLRDTCTEVDTRLAEGSGLWVFILSMVNPDELRRRAFFEGHNDREAPVRLGHYILRGPAVADRSRSR